MIDDKTNQMLIMFPIDKTRGLNRDKQQGRMLAHLIRTHARQGKDFIRQIGYRWLAAQKDHFDAQPDRAYRHLDQNIDSAWTATNRDKSLRLAGPDEQDYVQWMTRQWIPPSPLLREAERQKTGIGAHERCRQPARRTDPARVLETARNRRAIHLRHQLIVQVTK